MNSKILKNKTGGFDILSIISAIGIIGWLITDFFGGMILFLIAYAIIIIPILIIYAISFVETFISILRKGKQTSKIKLISHGIIILVIVSFNLYHSEVFKSKQVLKATLKDDLFYYTLIFRENGTVENQVNGFLGFSETFYGNYRFENNLVIFDKVPYDNNKFIPDTLFLDKQQNAIFMYKDKNGKFSRKKVWLNYFEIE